MNKKILLFILAWGWAVIIAVVLAIKLSGLPRLFMPVVILVGNYIVIKLYWDKKKEK